MWFFTINLIPNSILLKLATEDKFSKSKQCCVLRTDWSVRLGCVLWSCSHDKVHTCFLVKQIGLRFCIKKLHQRVWFSYFFCNMDRVPSECKSISWTKPKYVTKHWKFGTTILRTIKQLVYHITHFL